MSLTWPRVTGGWLFFSLWKRSTIPGTCGQKWPCSHTKPPSPSSWGLRFCPKQGGFPWIVVIAQWVFKGSGVSFSWMEEWGSGDAPSFHRDVGTAQFQWGMWYPDHGVCPEMISPVLYSLQPVGVLAWIWEEPGAGRIFLPEIHDGDVLPGCPKGKEQLWSCCSHKMQWMQSLKTSSGLFIWLCPWPVAPRDYPSVLDDPRRGYSNTCLLSQEFKTW